MIRRLIHVNGRYFIGKPILRSSPYFVKNIPNIQYIYYSKGIQLRQYSIVSQLEDIQKESSKDSITQQNKQKAMKVVLRYDSNRERYKNKIMNTLKDADLFSDEELYVILRHLYQRKQYESIMDVTEVLHLLNRISPIKKSAQIIIKTASIQKNIRIAVLMSNIISPDPFMSSIHSNTVSYETENPILEAQEISTLLSVHQLDKANAIIQHWSSSRLCNPLIFSSLLTGFVDGEYYKEAIQFYSWCKEHSITTACQSSLLTTVTVSLLIQAFHNIRQDQKAIQLFEEAKQLKIDLTSDVFEEIMNIYDTSNMWRNEYKDRIRNNTSLKDPRKREYLQSSLYLNQLYKGITTALSCNELKKRLHFYKTTPSSFSIDGTHLPSVLIRMNILYLFSSMAENDTISKGYTFIKIERNQEKAQAIEKLLSSDLKPAIRFKKEEKATVFVGGVKKMSSVNYVINNNTILKWCSKNAIYKTI